MPRPADGYGPGIPGATTIAEFWAPPKKVAALNGWARAEALAGRDHKETLKRAGHIGKEVHSMIEARIKGLPVICHLEASEATQAWAAFGQYEKFAATFPIEVVAQEIPLVSDFHKFGGTPDLVGRSGDQTILFDWKTSSGIYDSHGLQVAAYVALWDENYPEDEITGGAYILNFPKTGEFKRPAYLNMDDLHTLWLQFLMGLDMWRRQPAIEEIMQRAQSCTPQP